MTQQDAAFQKEKEIRPPTARLSSPVTSVRAGELSSDREHALYVCASDARLTESARKRKREREQEREQRRLCMCERSRLACLSFLPSFESRLISCSSSSRCVKLWQGKCECVCMHLLFFPQPHLRRSFLNSIPRHHHCCGCRFTPRAAKQARL